MCTDPNPRFFLTQQVFFGPTLALSDNIFATAANGSTIALPYVALPPNIPPSPDQLIFARGTDEILGWLVNGNVQMANGSIALQNIVTLQEGAYHLAALSTTGKVWTYAVESLGLRFLGVPLPAATDTFYNVALPSITQVAAIYYGTLAVDVNNSVWYWGRNQYAGDAGLWTTGPNIWLPVQLTWIPQYLSWAASLQPSPQPSYTTFAVTLLSNNRAAQLLFTPDYIVIPDSPATTIIPITSSPASCTGTAPSLGQGSSTFTVSCVNGVWIVTANLTSSSNSTIVITGPTVVQGTVYVPPEATINLNPSSSNSSSPLLVVNGCVNISGTVTVTVDQTTLTDIQQSGGSRTLNLIQAQCGNFTGQLTTTQPGSCHKTSSSGPLVTSNATSFGLAVEFIVDSSGCRSNTWWIILVSVMGGVIIVVACLALLTIFNPTVRGFFRPFAKAREGNPDQLQRRDSKDRLTNHEKTVQNSLYQNEGRSGSSAIYQAENA